MSKRVLRYDRATKLTLEQYRRARAAGTDTDYSAADWAALLDWFGGVCLCCGSSGPLTVDHVMPLARGGANSIRNLQPLCKGCNSRKGTQIIDYRDLNRLVQFLEMLGV